MYPVNYNKLFNNSPEDVEKHISYINYNLNEISKFFKENVDKFYRSVVRDCSTALNMNMQDKFPSFGLYIDKNRVCVKYIDSAVYSKMKDENRPRKCKISNVFHYHLISNEYNSWNEFNNVIEK